MKNFGPFFKNERGGAASQHCARIKHLFKHFLLQRLRLVGTNGGSPLRHCSSQEKETLKKRLMSQEVLALLLKKVFLIQSTLISCL